MNKKIQLIITFSISFIVAFLLSGFFKSRLVAISWVEEVTLWQKFKVYYLENVTYNIILPLVLGMIITLIIYIGQSKA